MAASMEPTITSRNAALPLGTLMLAASVGSRAQTQAAPQEKTLGTVTIKEAAEAPQGSDSVRATHSSIGKGNQELGAPDLTDGYWLYGNSKESMRTTITQGRHGVMPAHRELLGETRARLVASYVWSLSHKQAQVAGAAQ